MDLVEQLQHDGYAIVEGVLDQAEIASLVAFADELPDDGLRGGRRNLLALPRMRALASQHRQAMLRCTGRRKILFLLRQMAYCPVENPS